MAKLDEYSESWREAALKEQRHKWLIILYIYEILFYNVKLIISTAKIIIITL